MAAPCESKKHRAEPKQPALCAICYPLPDYSALFPSEASGALVSSAAGASCAGASDAVSGAAVSTAGVSSALVSAEADFFERLRRVEGFFASFLGRRCKCCLVEVHELDESHLRTVALTESHLQNPGISSRDGKLSSELSYGKAPKRHTCS